MEDYDVEDIEEEEEVSQEEEEQELVEEEKKIRVPKKLTSKIKDNESFYGTELTKLLRVKRTQVEMISDRGLDVGDDKIYYDLDYKGFYDMFKDYSIIDFFSNLSRLYEDKIYVYYPIPTGKQLSSSDITAVFKMISENSNIRKYIIISENNASPELSRHIFNIEYRGLFGPLKNSIRIQVFNHDEMKNNCSHNFLVPKHIIMSEKEVEELAKKVNLKDLARLLISDRQARYIGAEEGQVVKIIRNNYNPYSDNIVDISIAYRLVTSDKK